MDTVSDKIKIFYLSFVILTSMGIFLYLLDSWNIIQLEKYIPFLSKEAPLAKGRTDTPSELEWEELKKQKRLAEEKKIFLQEELTALEEEKENLQEKEDLLEKNMENLNQEKEAFQKSKSAYLNRMKMVHDMAERLRSMPPQEVVEIVDSWSNSDLVEVFLEMDQNATREGHQSIVPFLLTLLPRERAALLTTLMMDHQVSP